MESPDATAKRDAQSMDAAPADAVAMDAAGQDGGVVIRDALASGPDATATEDAGTGEDATVAPDATALPDATPSDSGASTGLVEIGTGRDHFEPLVTGQTVIPAAGPQGGGSAFGYNLVYAVRVHGMNPSAANLTFITYLASDHSEQARMSLTFDLQPDGSNYVFFGGGPPLRECCDVDNLDVIMRAEVTDVNGVSGADERLVHVGDCLDPGTDGAPPMMSICP